MIKWLQNTCMREAKLKNMELKYFPPNLTSVIQYSGSYNKIKETLQKTNCYDCFRAYGRVSSKK